MTAAVIPFPSRHVVYTAEEAARRAAKPANDSDLAASLDEATRRGDVIHEILSAAHGRRGQCAAKIGGRQPDAEGLMWWRREALLVGLIEIGEHGVGTDSRLLAAMGDLLRVLDEETRVWAQRRMAHVLAHRGPRTTPVPMPDLPRLRARLASMRSATPPSGPRSLLAADPRYVALRREAMDALGAVTGDLAPGVQRLGGIYTPRDLVHDLAQMARELDAEVMHPSKGNVPRMARQAAALALVMAAKVPALRDKAVTATERLEALASFVESGTWR